MFTNGRLKEHDPEKCSWFSDQIMLPQKGRRSAERRGGRYRGPADGILTWPNGFDLDSIALHMEMKEKGL